MGNFDYLKEYASELYEFCFFAEKYIHDDPDSTLVKLRKFSESAVRLIYKHKNMPHDHLNFYELSTSPKFYDLVPDYIYKAINYLRIEGNKGAHPKNEIKKKKVTKEMAVEAMKKAYVVALWIYKEIFKGEKFIPEFNFSQKNLSNNLVNRARQGDPDSQFSLALKYYIGRNIKSDINKASYWFREAAEQGHSRAQAYLGSIYLYSDIIQKSEKEALKWINKSIQQDEPIAQTLLGQMYLEGLGVEKDISKAIEWLLKAANNDDPIAQLCLGQVYQYGIGIDKDPNNAFKWIYRASQYDDPLAYCNLGLLYEEGIGVEQNFESAFKWYNKAANEGIPDAQAAVGAFYIDGVGCDKNIEQGLIFLHKAAEQKSKIAFLNLGLFYKNNKQSIDLIKAVSWLEKAAEEGDAEAQYELADSILMAIERNIKINYKVIDARKWMIEATKNGHPKAKKVMEELYGLRQQEIETHRKLSIALSAFRKNLQEFFVEISKNKVTQINYKDVGRNDPCPCGSGKKFKKCCINKIKKQ